MADTIQSTAKSKTKIKNEEILHGLPRELGVLCLAMVDIEDLESCSYVCRAWKRATVSQEFLNLRKSLSPAVEDGLFVLSRGMDQANLDAGWKRLDHLTLKSTAVPAFPASLAYQTSVKECVVAGKNILVVGIAELDCREQLICGYNVENREWRHVPPMRAHRFLFASACIGNFGYVAGGTMERDPTKSEKSAERFNCVTNEWEPLPDMTYGRRECSGFVMDGCFYVIGGLNVRNDTYSHGEYYDPHTNTWTTVSDLWPVVTPNDCSTITRPIVTVLRNELYSLNPYKNMIQRYNKSSRAWEVVSYVPGRETHRTSWEVGFVSLNSELWVIGGSKAWGTPFLEIHSYRPYAKRPHWREMSKDILVGEGFYVNSAIVKL